MKTKKFFLYEQPERTLVLNPANVVEKIDFAMESVFIFPGESRERIEKVLSPGLNVFQVTEKLENSSLNYIPIEDSTGVADMFCYVCGEDGGIFHLEKDFIPSSVYVYWDGSNWKEIWLDEDCLTEIVIDCDSRENLDRWDGQNWSFGGKFSHANLYRVFYIDSEPVQEKYLLEYWTQWEGDIPVGCIISAEEAEKLRGEEGEIYLHSLIG
jgi:hypothetical protein